MVDHEGGVREESEMVDHEEGGRRDGGREGHRTRKGKGGGGQKERKGRGGGWKGSGNQMDSSKCIANALQTLASERHDPSPPPPTLK